ncbi:MAG: putative Ig domain-containing protein, partial [Gemmatimonadaceae bacterium]|nr:putative Ig domain-containing protein [Gemmatimonadaceae bacterium]
TAALAATGYTVRVTDANGDTASAAFTLTVNGAVSASTAIASTRLTLGIAAVPTRPVQGTGGTGPRTFALRDSLDVASATLPTGLTFDPATGELAGLPAAALVPARRYTVRVTDALGSAASASFELTVNPALTATLDVASRVLTVGVADTLVPVRPGGGTAPYVFALRDASDQAATLPAGLAFDATSGRITGAIAAILPPTTYRVRITDANGAVAGEAFTLEARLPVVPPSAPLALAVAVADTVVSLTWDAPADSGNASITEYRIQYAVAGGATWTDYPRAASPMRSATLADLPLGPGYRFRVRAVNAAGVGAPSAETAEVVPARPLPDLGITMTADRTTLALGDTVTVTITVINSGRGWADDVVVPGLTADPRLALLATEASRGTVDSATDRWILGRVDGGTTATLRLRFLVRIPPQGGTP